MGTYLVMKNNMKRSLRHKPQFIIAFLLPVVICLLFGLIKFDKVSLRVGILGGDRSTTKELELITANTEQTVIRYATANENSMNTDLAMGRYHFILDFRGSKAINQFTLISNYPEQKEHYLATALEQSLRNRTVLSLEGMKAEEMSVTERTAAILLTLFLTIATIPCASIIRDKQSGILTRYRYAGRDIRSYLFGNALYVFLITLLQVTLCIGVLTLLQQDFHLTIQAMVLLTISITGMSTVYATIICYVSKSEVQANITAAALATIMSLLGGTFISVTAMPWLLRMLSYASPVRLIVELLRVVLRLS